MKYQPGAKVWARVTERNTRLPSGAELRAIVLGPSQFYDYAIEIEDYKGRWHTTVDLLRPRKDDDGNPLTLVSWDSCPWQPIKLKVS